jgi:hypothetical protein
VIALIARLVVSGAYSYEILKNAYSAVRELEPYGVNTIGDVTQSSHPDEVITKGLPLVVNRVIVYRDGLPQLVDGAVERSDPLYALGVLGCFLKRRRVR